VQGIRRAHFHSFTTYSIMTHILSPAPHLIVFMLPQENFSTLFSSKFGQETTTQFIMPSSGLEMYRTWSKNQIWIHNPDVLETTKLCNLLYTRYFI